MYFKAVIHVYIRRAGADNPLGTNVDVNRKPLSLCPFVASFKTISLKYDFKHILNDFIHIYSPRTGTDNPLRINFWGQQKALITLPIRCKFKKKKIWFYTHFEWWARADNPLGTNFWCQQTALITLPICCRFKKKLLRSMILYTFFSCFTICI